MRHSNAGVRISITFLFPPRRGVENQQSRSHPRCRLFFFMLGAFGARHIFKVCNPSRARMQFLQMLAANVLLASRFLSPASICTSLNFRCHPSARDMFFFNHADACQPEIGFPRWSCRGNQFCHSRPRCRSHFFITRALGQSA